jgi:predicted RNase H-like HicB family nuclease
MTLAYPAIFYPWDDGSGYTVEVPDLPGCVTEGDTLAEAMEMVADAASLWVHTELKEGRPAPAESSPEAIKPPNNAFVREICIGAGKGQTFKKTLA